MINKTEIPEMMENEVPVFQSRLNVISGSLFGSVKLFAEYTRTQMEQRNLVGVKRCFALADRMLLEGDMIVSSAVRNIYLYSVSKALEANTVTNKAYRSLMGVELRKEYFNQIYAKGS